MLLDDLDRLQQVDSQRMQEEIERLPDQLEQAYTLGLNAPAPPRPDPLAQIVIAGMGGSAIGGDLLAAYVADLCPVPILVHRDYGLPAFARRQSTLVVCSSHSGNTEETLDSFEAARNAGCSLLALCTGGELARRARQAGIPLWIFEHRGQPRAALGFSFGFLLALLVRLGLIPDQTQDVQQAVQAMRALQQQLRPEVETVHNPAKRYAGQLMERWVTVFGAGRLAPVARRMKTQINELAKAAATFEILPEADHNTLAGTMQPADLLQTRTMHLFLRAPSDHPRNRLRSDLTRQHFLLEGANTDVLDATGDGPLAHMWSLILFGDYLAYYLAIAYGIDPTPVDALTQLKDSLSQSRR